MPVPMKFVPDPHIPGADQLGIGDLHYDDGSVKFIEDPELALHVGQYPDSVDEINAASAASGSAPANGRSFMDLTQPPEGPPLPPAEPGAYTPAPVPGSTAGGAGFTPTAFTPDSEKPADPTDVPDISAEAAAAREARAAPTAAPGFAVNEPPPGPPTTGIGAAPAVAPPQLEVTGRTGRLDPEVAARQAEERANQNINEQTTLQQGRDSAFAIERADIRDQRIRIQA
jgi:hypothetical protein